MLNLEVPLLICVLIIVKIIGSAEIAYQYLFCTAIVPFWSVIGRLLYCALSAITKCFRIHKVDFNNKCYDSTGLVKVGIHTQMGAELVLSNNKLPWIHEPSKLIVGASFSLPASELVVSFYHIPIYIHLELTKESLIPVQEAKFTRGELVT